MDINDFFSLTGRLSLVTTAMRKRTRWRRRGSLGSPQKREFETAFNSEGRENRIKEALTPIMKRNLDKGIVLSREQLTASAKLKGLSVSSNEIDRFLDGWPEIKRFKEVRVARPASFQTIMNARYGTLFIDLGFIGEKRYNDGCVGFLLATECHSTQMGVIPIRKKSTEAIERAIEKLFTLTVFHRIVVILADRERAMFSQKFVDSMLRRFGIQLRYLQLRSKSYKAERSIRYIKTALSKAMAVKGTKRWLDFVKPIVDEYNRKLVPGTRFRRSRIESSNFDEFMRQKLGVDSFRALLNSSKISDRTIKNEEWRKAMWKYRMGQTVLVNARLVKDGKGVFFKPSVHGYFSPRPYVIATRYLSTTKKLSLIPGTPLSLFFTSVY